MPSDHPFIFNVHLADFQQQVLDASHQGPVLVDFWAEWCPPCLVIAPLLDALVADHAGALRLAKLEVDDGENMKLAGRYQVRGFPTVILFQRGEELGRFSGAQTRTFLDGFIADRIKNI